MKRKTIQILEEDYKILEQMKKETGKPFYFIIKELLKDKKDKFNTKDRR